jgi:D-alanine-D-alanine ligase
LKIAIVYNRESQAVINLFGTPNREKYGLDTIKRIQKALVKGGHQVKTFEGDKNFISALEKFMPAVITGERPDPESHALALDKVLTKMILIQKGLPTPAFAVLDTPDSPLKENLRYPLIVKPKSEAVSFGLRIVNNEEELKEGVKVIYEKFNSPTLVEEFIEGREFNVGLLGNGDNLQALPPLELVFGEG